LNPLKEADKVSFGGSEVNSLNLKKEKPRKKIKTTEHALEEST